MKPALLADAKKQGVPALALLANVRVWLYLPCLQVQTGLLLFKSKIRLVPHLFVFAFSFRGQNLPRASFASSAKNEFLPSGTLLGFAHSSPLLSAARTFPPPGESSNPARFDFISQFCRKVCKGFLRNDYGTDDLSAPSFLFFKLASVKNF